MSRMFDVHQRGASVLFDEHRTSYLEHRMSLRARFVLYLALLHAGLAGLAVAALGAQPLVLVAVEAALVLSLGLGAWLVRTLTVGVGLSETSADLLREGALGLRLRAPAAPELDRLAGTFNTLAGRLQAERVRLEEQQLLLDKILRAVPVGVLLTDFDGRVTFANAAAEAFAGPAEGIRLSDLPAPFGPVLAEGTDGTRALATPDGRRLRLVRGSYFDRGHPRTFVLIEELTDEVRRSEKAAYERLIRLVAHEVGNTTGAVGAVLQALPAAAPDLPPDAQDALAAARTRADGLAAFVRRLADVARLPDPARAPTDVAGLVRGVVAAMRRHAEAAGVTLTERIEAVPPVALDAVQLEQVLVNVVKNAVEAAGRGGHVAVRLTRERTGPVLTIEDDGGALTDEARAHLFTPFFTTKPDGQGLGLTLAREVLARHGFRYSLDGDPGGLTRFTIHFQS
jgi:two-component system, NtrC family, nitrogen regulation sensor histidine kinase NtrY